MSPDDSVLDLFNSRAGKQIGPRRIEWLSSSSNSRSCRWAKSGGEEALQLLFPRWSIRAHRTIADDARISRQRGIWTSRLCICRVVGAASAIDDDPCNPCSSIRLLRLSFGTETQQHPRRQRWRNQRRSMAPMAAATEIAPPMPTWLSIDDVLSLILHANLFPVTTWNDPPPRWFRSTKSGIESRF